MESSSSLEQKDFLVVVLHESRHYRLYSLYFVNNTSDTIDAMIALSPGGMEAIPEGTPMEAVDADLIDSAGVRKYGSIPPRSYIELSTYFDWDFDWSNTRRIMLKTLGREEHLRFDIEGSVMVGRELDFVPVLGKKGYVCLGKRTYLSIDGSEDTPSSGE
ncbi:MAG: hypothetical protein ABSD38_25975 [Syntrophorhabdales bacterium]|jgi:hypothetical protein